jgi:uncharacterized metal-binding protein YceD (DUF177 family)
MRIEVQKLAEGANPFAFDVSQEVLHAWVRDADTLYFAREGGASVQMDIMRTDDVVYITGSIRATIGFACARTLEEHVRPLDVALHWSLLPLRTLASAPQGDDEDAVDLQEDDLDVSFYTDEGVDLQELAREAVILDLEPCPRSSVDAEIPSEYTTAAPPSNEGATVDPRWAALAAWKADSERS